MNFNARRPERGYYGSDGNEIVVFKEGTIREGSVRTGTPRSMYESQWNSAQARLAELEAKHPDLVVAAKAATAAYATTSTLRSTLTSALNRADAELLEARERFEAAAAAYLAGKPADASSGAAVAYLTAVLGGLRHRLDVDVDAGSRSRLTDAESALSTLDGQIEGMRRYFERRPDPRKINWDRGTHHVGSDVTTGRVWFDSENAVAVTIDGAG